MWVAFVEKIILFRLNESRQRLASLSTLEHEGGGLESMYVKKVWVKRLKDDIL